MIVADPAFAGVAGQMQHDMCHPPPAGGQGCQQIAPPAAEIEHPQRPFGRPGGGKRPRRARQCGRHPPVGIGFRRQHDVVDVADLAGRGAHYRRQPLDRLGDPGQFGRQIGVVGIDHAPDFAGVRQRRIVQQAPAIRHRHRQLARCQIFQQRLRIGRTGPHHRTGFGGKGGEGGRQHAAAQQFGGLVHRIAELRQCGARRRQHVRRQIGGMVERRQQVEAENRRWIGLAAPERRALQPAVPGARNHAADGVAQHDIGHHRAAATAANGDFCQHRGRGVAQHQQAADVGRHHAGAILAERRVAGGQQADQPLQRAIEAHGVQQEAVIIWRRRRQRQPHDCGVVLGVDAGIDDRLKRRAVVQPDFCRHGDDFGAGDGDPAVMRQVRRRRDQRQRADLADGVFGPGFVGQMGAAGQQHATFGGQV